MLRSLLFYSSLFTTLHLGMAELQSCNGCNQEPTKANSEGLAAIIDGLCAHQCAPDNEALVYTWNARDLCADCEGEMELQPGMCNEYCVTAFNDIYYYCLQGNEFKASGDCLSGVWNNGHEWYWMYAASNNGIS